MTYNVFGETLSLTQSINQPRYVVERNIRDEDGIFNVGLLLESGGGVIAIDISSRGLWGPHCTRVDNFYRQTSVFIVISATDGSCTIDRRLAESVLGSNSKQVTTLQ